MFLFLLFEWLVENVNFWRATCKNSVATNKRDLGPENIDIAVQDREHKYQRDFRDPDRKVYLHY